MVASGNLKMPVRCSAPCPEDITCGEIMASRPTTAPPNIGRNAGFTRKRVNDNLTCRYAAHHHNAAHGSEHADKSRDHHVMDREIGYRAGLDAEPVGREDFAVK